MTKKNLGGHHKNKNLNHIRQRHRLTNPAVDQAVGSRMMS